MKLYISYLLRRIVLVQINQVGSLLTYTVFNFSHHVPPDRVITDWSHDP